MKIFNAIILKTIALVALGGACSSNAPVNNNPANAPVKTESVNAARPVENEANRAAPPIAEKTPEKTANASPSTPTDVYKAAYEARKNKDIEGLKKLMTKDILEFLTIVSGSDSPDAALRQMTETPQAKTDESRNEKITGETATLEYPDADGKWKTMDFARVNGEWKLTILKPKVSGNRVK